MLLRGLVLCLVTQTLGQQASALAMKPRVNQTMTLFKPDETLAYNNQEAQAT